MDINHFVIFFQFVIFSSNKPAVTAIPSSIVELSVIDVELKEITPLTLHLQNDRSLANKHLPIWNLEGKTLSRFDQGKRGLGEYHFFHEYQHFSAAVFSEKQKKYFGTIDTRYTLSGLQSVDGPDENYELHVGDIVKRMNIPHDMIDCPKNRGSPMDHKLISVGTINLQTPKLVYIKLLVIVDYNRASGSDHLSEDNIINILTIFNSVDMMFSNLRNPEVHITIAGIIFLKDISSLGFEECESEINREFLVGCINGQLQEYLIQPMIATEIPYGTYDGVVFFTPYFGDIPIKENVPLGMTLSNKMLPFEKRQTLTTAIPMIIMADSLNDLSSFYFITRRVIESLGYFETKYPPMMRNTEASNRKPAYKCMELTSDFKEYSKQFFSSENGCLFQQEPKWVQKPHFMWSANRHCECYGYKEARLLDVNENEPRPEHMCRANMYCLDVKNNILSTGLAPIGIKCAEEMACWNRECMDVTRGI